MQHGWSLITVLPITVLTVALVARAEEEEGARASFAKTQKVIARLRNQTPRDKRALQELYSRDTQSSRLDRDVLLVELQNARVKRVREKGDRAVVSFVTPNDPNHVMHGVLLKRAGEKWLIDCTRSFELASKGLDKRRGKKPVRVRLSMRTTNGDYGTSAYSFTYVSSDMRKIKNRVDIWFCHNHDFHVNGSITDLGKTSIKKATQVPLDATWGSTVRAEIGHTYVMRCGADDRRDFFVAFTVRALRRSVVEFDWTLLTGGHNAPASIHEAVPLSEEDQRAGADGTAGLCGKNGSGFRRLSQRSRAKRP